ncbi:MAG: trans-2-enoyl-CoA reductase family protein [Candidatus Omnitrophica bacterium]|nr:trans-2-enoyl-CoA reductase family protein [Candidatus Omnitrophota bacterium]
MIVKPKIRGFICTTAHPVGCAHNVQRQIDYVLSQGPVNDGPKKVLIIGASTGYGLASRIVAAFASRAATVGVFFEKEAEGKRTATAGYYNSVALEEKILAEGLYTKSVNGDAFSDDIKQQVVDIIKKDLGQVDLVIYSVAAPRRVHPKTGKISKSVLKPVGREYTNTSIDMEKERLEQVTLPAATDDEIEETIAVMGGEDWQYWIDALEGANLLAEGATTVAYSYVGPEVTQGVYRNGTIGRAKDHLERTANALNARLQKNINGRALISVNKALVTQSSSAIPFIPLYFVVLSKVMKSKGIEEDTIMQISRLFHDYLYCGQAPITDEAGFIRLDDFELRDDVQELVNTRWAQLTQENLADSADLEGYQVDFLRLFGFGLPDVDYDADVDVYCTLPSLKASPTS